jgi:hypothetical protein
LPRNPDVKTERNETTKFLEIGRSVFGHAVYTITVIAVG